MSAFDVVNVLDLADAIGEDEVKEILSDFSCPKNLEIEVFIKKNALDFSKKKMSVTYLVFDEEMEVAAIFSLTHKALGISNEGLSKTAKKKIQRFAQLDDKDNSYVVSAFLIAQFGKNYNYNGQPIEGDYLMQLVFEVLEKVQRQIGGGIVYLECEDREQLLKFYQKENNGFQVFDERYSLVDNTKFIQLFKFF